MAEVHCSRAGCERTFTNEHGLSVHLARGHRDEIEEELAADKSGESSALHAAERQPVDDEEIENPDEDVVHELAGAITLDEEEWQLVQALRFLYGYGDDEEVLCAAIADLLEWARQDVNVKNAMELRRRAVKG